MKTQKRRRSTLDDVDVGGTQHSVRIMKSLAADMGPMGYREYSYHLLCFLKSRLSLQEFMKFADTTLTRSAVNFHNQLIFSMFANAKQVFKRQRIETDRRKMRQEALKLPKLDRDRIKDAQPVDAY